MTLTAGDLFSGIGGFSLGLEMAGGFETKFFVEIDSFCQKVLRKHWPGVPIYDDIKKIQWVVADSASDGCRTLFPEIRLRQERETFNREFDGKVILPERIDLLTGGFPCQPFSCAGQRAGQEDDRYLWPETMRTIREIKPRWICLENVAGLLSILEPGSLSPLEVKEIELFLQDENYPSNEVVERIHGRIIGKIIQEIEEAGYVLPRLADGTPIVLCLPAASLGAPHRRNRIWIVAHAKSNLWRASRDEKRNPLNWTDRHAPDTECPRWTHRLSGQEREAGARECGNNNQEYWQEHWYEVATRFCRVDDGLPRGMDRVNRLKALGNAVVPQIVCQIGKAILGRKG